MYLCYALPSVTGNSVIYSCFHFRLIMKVLSRITFIFSPGTNALALVLSLTGVCTAVFAAVVVLLFYLKVRKDR